MTKARWGWAAAFDLTAELAATLKEYTGEVMDKVDEAAEVCGKGLVKDIKAGAPRKTNAYAKGWRTKADKNKGRGQMAVTAYNATRYQLTHLTEKPHKKRGGRGLTSPQPHIAPAAEKWQEEFARRCEEAVKGK